MMTPRMEAYCECAAMAYLDVAAKIHEMISTCPSEIKPFMEAMEPLATFCEAKSKAVFIEADRFMAEFGMGAQ